jgi:hypothetical protein
MEKKSKKIFQKNFQKKFSKKFFQKKILNFFSENQKTIMPKLDLTHVIEGPPAKIWGEGGLGPLV